MLRAIEAARSSDDPLLLARCLSGLGQIERDLHHTGIALEHYAHALGLYRDAGDALLIAHTARHLGEVYYERGSIAEAEPLLREALHLYRGDRRTGTLDLANTLLSVGILEARLHQPLQAAALFDEARQLYDAAGVQAGVDDCATRLRALLSLPSDQPSTERKKHD